MNARTILSRMRGIPVHVDTVPPCDIAPNKLFALIDTLQGIDGVSAVCHELEIILECDPGGVTDADVLAGLNRIDAAAAQIARDCDVYCDTRPRIEDAINKACSMPHTPDHVAVAYTVILPDATLHIGAHSVAWEAQLGDQFRLGADAGIAKNCIADVVWAHPEHQVAMRQRHHPVAEEMSL